MVDRFGKGTESAACKSWFLTHFHSDHYKGLTSRFKAGMAVLQRLDDLMPALTSIID